MTAEVRSAAKGTAAEDAACAVARLQRALLLEAGPEGAWAGELASSALATAVASAALHFLGHETHADAVRRGLRWLREHVNADRGWGDTPECPSNLATTVLVLAALRAAGDDASSVERRAAEWLRAHGGATAESLAAAVAASYGEDRTFSTPILAVAALCGLLGAPAEAWLRVPQLPFEAALLPQRLLAAVRLPVVSYALPALIAIGLLRHRHRPSGPLGRLRDAVTPAVLRRLETMQPRGGGFLEAVPLTAFVALSLALSGRAQGATAARCTAFLRSSQRADGSWPIDSNLATWVTTSAVEALSACGAHLSEGHRRDLVEWLLGQQHLERHPFTGAAPGGFSWTDLPGGVPDADDTAGALVALHRLQPRGDERVRLAAERAVFWLVGLQNADGGVPTFCRGWGRLPFDRSSPDVTAHVVAGVSAWRRALPAGAAGLIDGFQRRALQYLARAQQPDGGWQPLWFGNPWRREGLNPVYGTARVLASLATVDESSAIEVPLRRAAGWLTGEQNEDGGWGRDARGGSTVEETGLALAALAGRGACACVERGACWLSARVAQGPLAPAPIGLYFSSLWYSERLYPVVFATLGLGRFLATAKTTERAA